VTSSRQGIEEKILTVLNKLHPAMSTLQDDFFIIGATALILSGIPLITLRILIC